MLPSLLDEKNPHGILKLIESDAIQRAIKNVPEKLWKMTDRELASEFAPNGTDWAIRVALWNEIRRATQDPTQQKKIAAKEIYGGICSDTNFRWHILNNPVRVAWLFAPIRVYETMLEPLLYCGLQKYEEILNFPLYDKKGRPLPAVGKLIAQVIVQIENRTKGLPVDRKAHLHANVPASAQPGAPDTKDSRKIQEEMDRLNAEIEDLKRKERVALHLPVETEN